MTTISTSFTSATVGLPIHIRHGDEFTYDLSGTFAGTLKLEKTTSGGASWDVISSHTTTASGTVKNEDSGGADMLVRWECTAYTSGTAVAVVADATIVFQSFTDPAGNTVATIDEAGVNVTGDVYVTGNVRGNNAAQGGTADILGGTSSTSGNAGGAATVTGGTPGATGVGGAATIAGAAGGSTSGAGGVASITGGAGTAGNAAGGVSKTVGGAGQGSAAGGAAQLTGGVAGATGTGGAAQVAGGIGGATSGAGGAASVAGGAGTAGNSAGGAASVVGGAGQGTAAGGAVTVTGGASGAGATGNGGAATVTGGAAASTNGNGGGVNLRPGAGTGTGVPGVVVVGLAAGAGAHAIGCTRSTISNGGTLTAAQHRGLVIYQDASGGAVTCTTLTGTLLSAAFPDLAVGEALPMYHASNHATNTSTIAGGTDVTLIGSGAVINTGGHYLFIKTAATTFDLVRVG